MSPLDASVCDAVFSMSSVTGKENVAGCLLVLLQYLNCT